MIKLDELKPILEPLVSDENAVDIIEKVSAIDIYDESGSDPAANQKLIDEAVAEKDKEWAAKFKATFFGGQENQEVDPEPENEPEEEPEEIAMDDLLHPEN